MSDAPVSRQEFDLLLKQVEDLKAQLAALSASDPDLTPEVVEVIAAAVAAFLGKRATVKFVRRTNESIDPWRTQGRVNIQAARQTPQTRGL